MGVGKALCNALAALLVVAAGGCDIFDFEVDLAPQTFRLDFGQQSGTVPTVACDATADVCGSAPTLALDTSSTTGAPSEVEVALGCDGNTGTCFAQANARVAQGVAVLQDDGFWSRVGRNALSFVQLADIGYTIPSNTLTFEVPQIDIYAGPAGSLRETDAGVAVVGSTQPIPAGTVITDEQHLVIDDGTPARGLIEDAIENKRDFVFIVVAAPRMGAGSTFPAGAVQIDIFPSLIVGLPR
jgi:hypothetical protein